MRVRGIASAHSAAVGCLMASLLWLTCTPAPAAPPDSRVYEQVTPAEETSADVIANAQRVRGSRDGNAVEFASLTGFGDVRGTGVAIDYVANRNPDGQWVTHSITPPQGPSSASDVVLSGFEARYLGDFSADLSQGIFLAKTPLTDAPNVAAALNLYLRTDVRTPGPGSYTLLTDATTLQAAQPNGPFAVPRSILVGMSDDSRYIAFESSRNLTADAVAAGLDPTEPKLYVWADGVLRLAGILPDDEGGSPTISQSGPYVSFPRYSSAPISKDGHRVQFTGPPFSLDHAEGALYLRDDHGTASAADDTTVRVNATERTDCNDDPSCGGDGVPDPTPDPFNPGGVPRPARFWTASSDGSKVFFTTSEQLADDDVNGAVDLYRFDLDAPAGNRLTRLAVDDELSDNFANDVHAAHTVSGVLGASVDGDYVYFTISQGQLVAGGPTGPSGVFGTPERIFVWHNGSLHHVGTANVGEELNRNLGTTGWGTQPKWAQVSPDGTHLVFITQGSSELLTLYGAAAEYNHGSSCKSLGANQCNEAYVYDASANGGTGDLQCASCNPTGAQATSDADFYTLNTTGGGSRPTTHLPHVLSDDGRFVFFNSAEQLTPADHNHALDAYEYDTTTRQVHLISAGTGADDSAFMEASPDGHNVFFTTRDRLSPTDVDQSRDLYDARIGGTAAQAPPSLVPCTGDACRTPTSGGTSPTAPPSVGAAGPEDSLGTAGPPAIFSLTSLTSKQRRNLAKGRRVRLAVATSQSGTVVVRVTARLSGHRHTVDVARRTLERAGTLRLPIRLNDPARRQLASNGRLRLTITTSYSHSPTPQTLRVTLGGTHA